MPNIDWFKERIAREIVREINDWPAVIQSNPAIAALRDRIGSQAQSIDEYLLVDLQRFVNAIRTGCWCRTVHNCRC